MQTMKSQSYPDSIPSEYANNELLERAYRIGWNRGHGIACHNVPTIGERRFSESLGRVTVGADNIREIHESICYEVEMNARQFSPFEFYAAEFNKVDESEEGGSEEAWEAYDQGVCDSISADLATYTNDDYGIAAE